MMRTWIAILCGVAVSGCANGARAGERPRSEPDRIFALIDRFDSQKTEDVPFVRVATGRWVRYDDDPPTNRYRFGFLENAGERGSGSGFNY
jgi:hypothetical protein